MRPEYIQTLDSTIVKYDKWYVDGAKFKFSTRQQIDQWCREMFGSFRHDHEVDEGWWLQSEEEHTMFWLSWYENMDG